MNLNRRPAHWVFLIAFVVLLCPLACAGPGRSEEPSTTITLDNAGNISQISRWEADVAGCEPEGTACGVSSLAFSPDSRFLASGGWDGALHLYRLVDGVQMWTRREQSAVVSTVVFSPDGTVVATGSGGGDNKVRLWRASDGALLQTWDQPVIVDILSFSPDGRILAVPGANHSINLWQVGDGVLWRTLEPPATCSLAFAPDGQTLVVSTGREVYLWQLSDGALLRTVELPDYAGQLAFMPDGQTVVLVSLSTMWLWRTSDALLTQYDIEYPQGYEGFGGPVVDIWSAGFSPNRQLFAAGATDGVIWLWRISDGQIVRNLTGHTANISEIAFSADGRFMASGSEDGTIRLWGVR